MKRLTGIWCRTVWIFSLSCFNPTALVLAPSYTPSPSDLKIMQTEAKGYILCLPLTKSCLLIAWCVPNGLVEQWRQQRDEWMLRNNWHIRERLIKATMKTRTHTAGAHTASDGDVLHATKHKSISKDTSGWGEHKANRELWSNVT